MHDKNFVYKCDPNKNTECAKTDCQICCFMTTHAEFSADGKRYIWDGNHIKEYKGERNEQNREE